MITKEDFNFTQDELEILFWCKYWCVNYEIGQGNNVNIISQIFSKNDVIEKKESEVRDHKLTWLVEWSEIIKQLLHISQEIDEDDLSSDIKKLDLSDGKSAAFAVELSTFTPYFALEENSKEYKNLRFSDDLYVNAASHMLEMDVLDLENVSSSYKDAISDISKKISGSNHAWLWLGIGAAVLLLVAPYLAGVIGGVMGLSGAAATSAGLAFLGGGSLAAGGFGMAGGYVAVMAGGAIFGYKTGSAGFQSRVRASTKEELLISCAKVTAVLDLIPSSVESKSSICESARILQIDYEALADENYLKDETIQGKDYANKAAILVAFRGLIRSA